MSEDDAIWRSASAEALGEAEGTVIVMDAQTGRLRAVVNPRLAFEQSFPPGSAIKPFTALAALQSGIASRESRTECKQHYAREDYEITCSHPIFNYPLNLPQALAQSCNYYFSRLGEKLSASAFNSTLANFGFGTRTGINAVREATGTLNIHDVQPQDSVGESEHLLVTPIQLINAYAALVNGGHLLHPRLAEEKNFQPQEARLIGIAPAHRVVLIEGMSGAVRNGTASHAGFEKLPFEVIGKTGTSTSSNGFRTQGWFVCFVAERKEGLRDAERFKATVLVLMKRAHGAQAAEVARRVIKGAIQPTGAQKTGAQASRLPVLRQWALTGRFASGTLALQSTVLQSTIRVRLTGKGNTRQLSLEDYVRGVLAGEASAETELEALKAQAIASRTFALKNIGRHAKEGYDFCDLTHCQNFKERPASNQDLINRAVVATSGEVLKDKQSRVADVYFHASCGGRTTSIADLWGGPSLDYLRGVSDETCSTLSHRQWIQTIPADKLASALGTDKRSDVGSRLNKITVNKRDQSGRATLITLSGVRQQILRGWDFALIVNRVLGWNTIRSTKFEVQRKGNDFVFRGSGLGHGLGLCQEGAHLLAVRKASFRQILNHYFPGTHISQQSARADFCVECGEFSPLYVSQSQQSIKTSLHTALNSDTDKIALADHAAFRFYSALLSVTQSGDKSPHSINQARKAQLSSEHFRVSYPQAINKGEIEAVIKILEQARTDIAHRLSAASLKLPDSFFVNLNIHPSTGDFVAATGQPPWVAAATRGREIQLQPLSVLRKRAVLIQTLRHEFAHTVIESISRRSAPRWLVEGLAIHFAGEARMLKNHHPQLKLTRDELEEKLSRPASANEMRALYAAASREVQAIISTKGEAQAWSALR